MEKDLLILGAGGFGREVAWLVERINTVAPTWNLLGFLDDTEGLMGKNLGGVPVLGTCDEVIAYPNAWYICAVGSANDRKKVIRKVTKILPSIKFTTLIDPSVLISKRVSVGEGTIICAGTIITVDITIGNHVIINLDCTVGHDAVLENFVTLYPSVNVSGFARIGESCEMGTGSQIIQSKKICPGSIIGAGAVVVEDITEKCTAVGVPARSIKFSRRGSDKGA